MPVTTRAVLLLLFLSTAAFAASPGYEKGLEDGAKFGREAGAAKGAADGKAAADAAGFAKGMEDERTNQPPPASAPAAPPTTADPASDPESADRLGQAALARHPDLVARPSALASPEDSNQYGIDYSKGFALGLAAGFAETYGQAKQAAYEDAWPAAYARGRAEYRRLYKREDGTVIPPREQFEMARQAMLLERWQEATLRFDIAIAAEGAAELVPAALYYKAKTFYSWSKPKEALHVLVKLLENYADGDFGDDGYFLAGAAYEQTPSAGFGGFFGGRRYPQARDAYRTLAKKYPQSALLPDAYFRIGFTSEKIGEKPAAIEAYKVVVERFADSPLAEQARKRLERLR